MLAFFTATASAAPPPLSLPGPQDFGDAVLNYGESEWRDVQINHDNSSLDPVTIDSVSVVGPDASSFRVTRDGCSSRTLLPDDWCNMDLVFEPERIGYHSATLLISTGDDAVVVSLSGFGLLFSVVPSESSVDYGKVAVGDESTRSVDLENVGNMLFEPFVAIVTGGDVADFRLVRDGCVLTAVGPGDACTVTVKFAPVKAGARTANLLVFGDGDPVVVPLIGESAAQKATPPPATADTPPAPAVEPHGSALLGLSMLHPVKLKSHSRTRIFAQVTNRGAATAKRTRVCVAAPRRRVAIRRCIRLGRIEPGGSKRIAFGAQIRRAKLRKRGRGFGLTFKASAAGSMSTQTRTWIKTR